MSLFEAFHFVLSDDYDYLTTCACRCCCCLRSQFESQRHFMQEEDVTDAERDEAWKRITAAAKKFGVEMEHKDWRELK